MNVGIVGGGMMGLSLAYRLSQEGHVVTVFESASQLGGLTTHHDYGAFIWDRFYHVILPSDVYLIQFLKDIGLGEQLQWERTLTGYYVDQKFYSISNTLEFLRFPPLGIIAKLRLALTLIYGSRLTNWRKLEKIPVEKWLLKLSGERTYRKFWKPLLLAKLGENYKRVSAVFIWSYIKRLFSARDSSLQKEQLGYVKGGYKAVFDRLQSLIKQSGGEIRLSTDVMSIIPHSQQGVWIESQQGKEHFDKVVFTAPVNVLQSVASPSLAEVRHITPQVEYLGVICLVLVTRVSLVPYYVVNLADAQIPFTGIIGMSNIVSLQETDGFHLTYCPKYILSDDPMFDQSDEELQQYFSQGIHQVFPFLKTDDLVSVHINRARKVQPLQVINFSKIVPSVRTENPDFFVLNTSQFVNDTLNNNSVVQHVTHFVEETPCFGSRSLGL
jgi:protoporphyrinogen oxidase